ncbi:TPA: ead/Ea22-like family protein [Salmonella enterica subsp. enterica serovar Veneziana]|nr:ead/Ea22-like family protein [Salmonella enterica subsp. enterica serovar Veneziana]
MTAIDKQALRQLATDAHELGIIKRYTKGIEANKRFAAIVTPLTVLALLDELEAAEKRIAELESENGKLQGIAREQNEIAIMAQMERNGATMEMRILHKRIAILVGRAYIPQPLNIENEYQNHEYVAGWNDCRNAASVRQQTPAVCDVIAERYRQKSVEGWTPEHDDEHRDGVLALAASCYAENFALFSTRQEGVPVDWSDAPQPANWPLSSVWWKPSSPRGDLVKAGALILAEIERGDRAVAAGIFEG